MEGVDEVTVVPWLLDRIGLEAPLDFELIPGGRSNLTFAVTDSTGRVVVLRRPPAHHVLPTAHDMSREHRIITALRPTAVPVPEALGFCDDVAVNGAPFYVMEFVSGLVLRDPAAVEASLAPAARRRAGESMAEVLAELHAVDPAAVGLGELGRSDGYLRRQLDRWHGQFDRSQIEGEERLDLVDETYEWLSSRVPPQQSTTIVHGDYRLDNTVLGSTGEVRAVLDWEICTLGDPLADLGILMVYWSEPGDEHSALGTAPTLAPGFASRSDVREHYAGLSGRDISGLGFYISFAYWKLACILQGVHSRYVAGAPAGDRSGTDSFVPQIRLLAEAAAKATAEL